MLSARWRKVLGDVARERERLALMVGAVTVSLAAVGAVMGAYGLLGPAMARSYEGTHPAALTLELPGGVTPAVLEVARRQPGVADAEAHDVLQARALVHGEWRPMLLFLADDPLAVRQNRVRLVAGHAPDAAALLLERTASALFRLAPGERLELKTAHGSLTPLAVAGLVHDPSLAPSWQERTGYGYLPRSALATLGEADALHELRIAASDPQAGPDALAGLGRALAHELTARGIDVHEVRVPPPHQHPHQRQMTTVLYLLMAFSLLALVLSGVLLANVLAAILARQVREIGVMKVLGAAPRQLAALYAVLVLAVAGAAVLVAVPLGRTGAGVLAAAVADLLNFDLPAAAPPAWVMLVQVGAGLALPLLLAAVPIAGALRMSVRDAIDQHGAASPGLRVRMASWPRPVRDLMRRPRRLLLTAGLLACAGALFLSALNLKASWELNIAKVYATHFYDVDVRMHEPADARAVQAVLAAVPGVRRVEAWGYAPAAFRAGGERAVSHVYPDKSHASLTMLAPPDGTALIRLPLLEGRWLYPGEQDAVVLTHAARAQRPGTRVGDVLEVSVDGRPTRWRVVGVVEEVGSAGIVYTTQAAFDRTNGSAGRAAVFRVAVSAPDGARREEAVRAVERALYAHGYSVAAALPLAELRTAMSDHIAILIDALLALAATVAVVGTIGVATTTGISVTERTREIGIYKTLGAAPGRIMRLLQEEAAWTAALGWVAGVLVSLPLTWMLDGLVGRLGFVAPLPFAVSWPSAGGWALVLSAGGALACWAPARRAVRLPIAAALASV
ncbi:MAG: FtsX-like permease family protein [Telluria sp.]